MFVCCSAQELANHVGLNVAQASSESIGAKEIQELIERDIPQVGICVLIRTILHPPPPTLKAISVGETTVFFF